MIQKTKIKVLKTISWSKTRENEKDSKYIFFTYFTPQGKRKK